MPLIDMLKEAVLRAGCLAGVIVVAVRGERAGQVLAERLLLAIYAYGTNTGIRAVAGGARHGHSEDDIRYVRRRYLTAELARAVAVEIANATFAARAGAARHVDDLASLLDAWGHDRVVLVGHSFETDLAFYFLLAHPERVAGLVQLAGHFLDPWRDGYRVAQRVRRTAGQQARLDELEAIEVRTEAEEVEYLTLSWFTDHADRARAWGWALASARARRPVNYAMNASWASRREPIHSNRTSTSFASACHLAQ